MTHSQRQDVVIGLILFLLALLGLFVLIPRGIVVPEDIEVRALSPDFWPTIIMVGLALAGLVILLQGFLSKRSHPTGD